MTDSLKVKPDDLDDLALRHYRAGKDADDADRITEGLSKSVRDTHGPATSQFTTPFDMYMKTRAALCKALRTASDGVGDNLRDGANLYRRTDGQGSQRLNSSLMNDL